MHCSGRRQPRAARVLRSIRAAERGRQVQPHIRSPNSRVKSQTRQSLDSLRVYAVAADGILVVHAAVALFAVLGAPLLLVNPRIAIVHVLVVVWSSTVNLAHWICPLTPLEKRLRARAGQSSFEGSWVQHYLEPLVRPLGMPRRLELVAGTSIVVWNACLYGIVWYFGPWRAA